MVHTRTRLEEILILRSELTRLMDEFHSPMLDHTGSWAPPTDCSEDPEHYYVNLELSGVLLSDVELSVKDQTFTIEGVIHPHDNASLEAFHRIERFHGRFKRSLTLPLPFREEEVDANLKDGVLSIVIPKKVFKSER